MNICDIMLFDFVLITFPLTLYLFYVAYNQNICKRENYLFFNITLLLSLYLITRFGVSNFYTPLMIIAVPLIIAYYKKDNLTITLLSMILITYNYTNFKFNIFILLIEYILYYIVYYLFNIKKKNFYYFLIVFIILKIFFSSLMLWQTMHEPIIEIILKVLFLSLMTIIISFFSLILINKGEEIMKYHMSIKKLEREKQIKTSLFKITHEIKNPLAVCKGYLDMLDTKNSVQVEKYIPIIKSEIDRTLVLLQDFLCMNKTKIVKEPMDINLLIEDVVNSFDSIFKQKNIECNLQLIDDEIYINGDYNRLTQVFINIIKNSIEAIDKDCGIINIRTSMENDCFKVTIKDNGCGITSDVMNRISEPFFTTKKNGTGLGVALSKEILNAHKATMEYDSKLGKGTLVTILMPIEKGENV